MSDAQERRVWKRQAAAIKQLEACSSGPLNARGIDKAGLKQQQQPKWDSAPVRLAAAKRRPAPCHTGPRLGQAVLSLPLAHADVALQLPPALQLAATPAGSLDCRLQLFGITADWPVQRHEHEAAGGSKGPHMPCLLPAKSAAAGFACRSGALLLAHALFPDHTRGLLGWLAVPVAVADGLAAVQAVVPGPARTAVAVQAGRLKDRLQGRASKGSSSSSRRGRRGSKGWACGGVGWVDGTVGVMQGSLHMLRCLSGPAAALGSAGWLWGVLHPSSHSLCSCLVALMAVAADYSTLSRDISRGHVRPGPELEAAWHVRHKRAAQRLAGYCGDLPAQPPLQPLLRATSCCSIAAGLAVEGQALSGLLAAGTAGGWPCSSSGRINSSGAVAAAPQLVLSCIIHEPTDGSSTAAKSKQHAAAGLSRKQLLELFTGSGEEPGTAAAAAGGSALPLGAGTAESKAAVSRRNSTGSSGTAASSADITIHVNDAHDQPEIAQEAQQTSSIRPAAAAAAAAAACDLQQQLQLVPHMAGAASVHCLASLPAGASAAAAAEDPLTFLEHLPLYGQQDHAHSAAAQLDGKQQQLQLLDSLQLALRAVYLLVVFTPFLLLGVPALLLSWYLLSRAAAAQQGSSDQKQQQQQGSSKQHGSNSIETFGPDVAVVSPLPPSGSSSSSSGSSDGSLLELAARTLSAVKGALSQPVVLLRQLLRQLLVLLTRLAALLDLLLVLLLGGHWAAGVGAWESAGLFLRRCAWRLLLFSSSAAGAAFIKWGQWSSSRRDIFPADFCDTLAALHDKAPVHSFRHTRRTVEAAFGRTLQELFERFDPNPMASGSIAQVHRATLRSHQATAGSAVGSAAEAAEAAGAAEFSEVVVKVCHPRVHRHICLDFRLLTALSAAAARVPALRGLSLRESVAQFSHTMTAQTDMRVEAVHALRFLNNFSGVASSVQIPRPVPGLVSQQVLVETYEPGQSVAQYMRRRTPINAHIVGLGVDAFLKMLLVDNFVHTDLHPGNILFRAVPHKHARSHQQQQQQQQRVKQHQQQQWQQQCSGHLPKQQQQQEQQQGQGYSNPGSRRRRWQFWRALECSSRSLSGSTAPGTAVGGTVQQQQQQQPFSEAVASAQWELELQQMIGQQQRRWASKHAQPAADGSSSTSTRTAAAAGAAGGEAPAADEAALLLEQQLSGSLGGGSSSSSSQAALEAQLVLLDFGLAEQLTDEVRHHFISFLNAIAAGNGLSAARHLLCWSHSQACADRRGFTSDIMELFEARCQIGSEAGIDLDGVMKAVLGLARKWGVSIDSCYASLVISVCVLVGFAQALDPGVNILDAATPGMLAYSLTGKVLGRLYS